MEYIYTITTLRGLIIALGGTRCVGWYPTFEQAEKAVVENYQDIYELGYYPFCVIEKVQYGIYCIKREEHWYKWDEDLERYIKISRKPDLFEGSCCYSLG